MRKRTGLFGGSFNPIHLGHVALAQSICDSQGLEEFWFMVSPQNPFKRNMTLLDDDKRLHMAQLAVAKDDRLVASDFEFSLPRPSYTYHTLQALHAAYPDRAFELIIGADNWKMFPHWYHHDDIVADTPVIIYPRPGYPIDASTLPEGIQLVEAPLLPFSATDVRNTIEAGEDASQMLDPLVWEYIQQEKLYGYRG